MRKNLLALLLALALALTAAGCGGISGEEEKGPEKEPEPTEQADEAGGEEEQDAEQQITWKPAEDVTVMVPNASGHIHDITARVLGQYLEGYVGQRINVEDVGGKLTQTNEAGEEVKVGGAGSRCWVDLAKREPDGLTLGYIVLPTFSRGVADWPDILSEKDYVAVCTHTMATAVIVVRKNDTRFSTLEDLLTYGREHPGELIAATDGERGYMHAWVQLLAREAEMPYGVDHAGSVEKAVQAVRSGQADFCAVRVDEILEQDDGLQLLGVYSQQRLAEYPDVPTLEEQGCYDRWQGYCCCVVAPAGTSDEAVAFYERAYEQAITDPRYQSSTAGVVNEYRDAAATAALIAEQKAFVEELLGESFWTMPGQAETQDDAGSEAEAAGEDTADGGEQEEEPEESQEEAE